MVMRPPCSSRGLTLDLPWRRSGAGKGTSFHLVQRLVVVEEDGLAKMVAAAAGNSSRRREGARERTVDGHAAALLVERTDSRSSM